VVAGNDDCEADRSGNFYDFSAPALERGCEWRGGDHGVHKPRSPVTAPHRMLTAHTGYEIEPTGLIVTTPAQRSSEGPPDVAAG